MHAYLRVPGVAIATLGLLTSCTATPSSRANADPGAMRIEVDKSHRELYVYHGDQRIESHKVAIGMPSHPTPTGTYAIHQIDWNPDWKPTESDWAADETYKPPGHPENPMGRVRMIFKAPYTVHGTDAHGSLGKAASHGSIRLANEVIIDLAPKVMAHGGAPQTDEWVQQALANPTEMRTVNLPEPVPIRIYE